MIKARFRNIIGNKLYNIMIIINGIALLSVISISMYEVFSSDRYLDESYNTYYIENNMDYNHLEIVLEEMLDRYPFLINDIRLVIDSDHMIVTSYLKHNIIIPTRGNIVDYESSDRQIIIHTDYLDDRSIGDNIIIDNIEYSIVGIGYHLSFYQETNSIVLGDISNISLYQIKINNSLGNTTINELTLLLQEMHGENNVLPPKHINLFRLLKENSYIRLYMLFILAFILTTIYCYYIYFKLRDYADRVLYTLGWTRRRIIISVFIENIIAFHFYFIAGALFACLFTQIIYSRLLTFYSILAAYILGIIIIIGIVSIFLIIRAIKRSIYEYS